MRPPFAELHCLSNYSFLRAASQPEELVDTATTLGYSAIAITDECSVAGAVKAHLAAKAAGIKLIIGTEIRLSSPERSPVDSPERLANNGIHLVLLARNRQGYAQLCTLITKGRRRAVKGSYELRMEDLDWGLDQCLALWIPGAHDIEQTMREGAILSAKFKRLWIALELFHDGDDLDKTANALTLSIGLKLPLLAANDIRLHDHSRQPLLDVVSAIRLGCSVDRLGHDGMRNAEHRLRGIEELLMLYPKEMLEEAHRAASLCEFSLDELRYEYPRELVPEHLSPQEYLRQLTFAGAIERWPGGIPEHVQSLIDKELALVAELSYEYYFLTVQDIVQFARSQGILCQGRGSAANSAVCYCLHITEVDPSRMSVLFERFVSKERNEPPDIDVDFEHERREEVIQYIYKRYSRERAALAATLITYRPKSAIRDVGKALGMDQGLVDLLSKSLAWWDKPKVLEERLQQAGLEPKSRLVRQFLSLVQQIMGFPRHLSQHVGGFVISRGPLMELVPVENAAMEDRTVIQWDKNDLEALGLLKVDVLGLGMLTAIRKALSELHAYRGVNLSIQDIPAEDEVTYRMLQRGDSVGVFQVESRAQMTMLPRLRPQNFYDLVIEVAIVRPGPIQGDMVHPYLRRRQGLETVTYSDDGVRRVLERTLGVPIFQEQVIELAMVAAGFSAGEADQLRRAMAAWKRRGGLEEFEAKLIDGMLARGHDRDFAQRVFQQIQGFGEYGFPESHAASFALLVYVSAWLKCHEPAAFCCGLLNALPMGFYSPSQLIQDARRHGIEVREVDVQNSRWDHHLQPPDQVPGNGNAEGDGCDASPGAPTGRDPSDANGQEARHFEAQSAPHSSDRGARRLSTEGALRLSTQGALRLSTQGALRLGLRLIKGLSREAGLRIEANQPYQDVSDLRRRAELDDRSMRMLARAGALTSLSSHRYQAHWDVAGIGSPTQLQAAAESPQPYETEVQLETPGCGDDVISDYRYLGLSLTAHPMALLRGQPRFQRCCTAADLSEKQQGEHIQIGGVVTGRQRPATATGVMFITLEDESGNANIVVWSSMVERFRAVILQSQLLLVKGHVEKENEVIHVIGGYFEDCSEELSALSDASGDGSDDQSRSVRPQGFRSRDFH